MPPLARLLPLLAMLTIVSGAPAVNAAGMPQISLTFAHTLIRPGERQTITVTTTRHRQLTLSVVMPNGLSLTEHGSSSAGGTLRFSFVQPANVLSHHSRVVIVRISLGSASASSIEGRYRVAFAAIDLVVPSEPVPENSSRTVWIHTQPATAVQVRATIDNGFPQQETSGTTGSHGWYAAHFKFPNPYPSPHTITVGARARVKGRSVSTTASLTVQAFTFTAELGAYILHGENGAWVETEQVTLGETFRVAGHGVVHEPAGAFSTFVPGTVTIRKGDAVLATAELKQDPMYDYLEYAELRLTDPADVGPLQAVIEVKELDNPTYRLPFTLVNSGS